MLATAVLACLAVPGPPAPAQEPAAAPAAFDPFDWGLKLPKRAVPRRASRYFAFKGPGPTTLVEMEGPGCIRRIWITGGNIGRSAVLRVYFDGEPVPYVEAPLGDFFGAMHNLMADRYPHDHARREAPYGEAYTVNTPFLAIKPKNGFTAYFPMPYASSARVEVVGGERNTSLYYLIDWHEYPGQEMEEPMRFSARWRRESPVRDYTDDYIVLDADGPGRLVGFVYAVDMLVSREQMRWSHAGADSIYIDGDGEHPAYLRGIGGEDSFGTSYSGGDYLPQSSLYSDMPFYVQQDDEGMRQKLVGYRFFVNERIDFEKSVHMRFGARSHDISSMVYWYAASPVRPFFEMPPEERRLPGSEIARGEFDLELLDTGSWSLAGPFGLEAEIAPPAPQHAGAPDGYLGQPWQPFRSIRGFVEFNHVFRPDPSNDNSPTVEGYAVAQAILVAPAAGAGELTFGWSDRMTVRINDGEPVDLGTQKYHRGRTVPVQLREGENTVSVVLRNGPQAESWDRGAWNFSFRAVTSEGKDLLPRAPME